MKQLTDKQKILIKEVEKAIKALGKVNISLIGMDNQIYYATKWAIDNSKNIIDGERYNDVGNAYQHFQNEKTDIVGSLNVGNVYVDSGGW